MTTPILAIHGGAGTITRSDMSADKEAAYQQALNDILAAGQRILVDGGSALDAVTEAVRLLEECTLFNAGKERCSRAPVRTSSMRRSWTAQRWPPAR